MPYDFRTVEPKWRKKWTESGLGEVDLETLNDKFYILTMFPYPSGDRLHMGHWYQYGIMDSWSRFQKMLGKNVFQPMGFDAFGLPAENFAIKKGIHPDVSTSKNVEIMISQFRAMGVAYAWRYMVNTSKPDYYRWTQWLFLKLFEAGLAFQKEAPVNWCNSCQTVLANEQVIDGSCERCESTVIQKNLKQWFFKITEYADRLLNNIEGLDWPERTKLQQKHWIGKSEGAEIFFAIEGQSEKIKVFTTRPDTLFGVTYVVLAPEHPLSLKITDSKHRPEVEKYIQASKLLTEIERQSTVKEKTGVFTGSYALHPATQEKVPVWVADYVLGSYGTGAVMAVPSHDVRDFAFAKKYKLPFKEVIQASSGWTYEQAYEEGGKLVNSGEFDGMDNEKAKRAIVAKHAVAKVNFRLRDWLVSRQRYWGTPIPIIHCGKCGIVPVPEEQLPVELPKDVDFKPTGESPLKRCESFIKVSCPKCKGPAEREADTLDTFVCSSWYFLRFPSSQNSKVAFDPALTKKMLPVDKYVGGNEHACMHLLYARFMTMFLKDRGFLDFEEPFPSLTHQGLVLGRDGQKMSKSKGNAVSPDPYVEENGSDVLRLYLMFGFNYVEGGPWEDGGFKAVSRFLERVSRLLDDNMTHIKANLTPKLDSPTASEKKLLHLFHSSLQRATADAERFQFNTSIARYMEFYNGMTDYLREEKNPNTALVGDLLKKFIVMLAPFAPHFAEEYWEQSQGKYSVFDQEWPKHDPKYLELDTVAMAVMINGKLRDEIQVASNASQQEVEQMALASAKIQKFLEGKTPKKVILVPKKLINLIVG